MEQRTGKRDALIALLLALLTLTAALLSLDSGHLWGDDFAAYLLEGRAIVEGTVKEQTQLNLTLHPSRLDFGGKVIEGPLVYVWGLPMLLSIVYRLVGYDMPAGTQIIWYKLPGVLMLSAASAIAYLFFRRRFSRPVSAVLSAALCLNWRVITESNSIHTDIPCLMLSLLALLLIECFLSQRGGARRLVTGAALGAAMWFTCEMRLNGKTVAAVIALAHVIGLLRERPRGRAWLVHLVPWMTMAALWGITRLFLPAATSNTYHIAGGANWWILYNIQHYDMEISEWVVRMLPVGFPLAKYAHYLFYALALIGVAAHGLKENLHLTALVFGTFAVLYLLPYFQGLRYMLNILPLLLMFAAYGAAFLVRSLSKHPAAHRLARVLCGTVLAVLTLGTLQQTVRGEIRHMQEGGIHYRYEAYSDDMVDMYAYVHENTEEDALFAYFKPRALYLNTGRVGFVPGENDHLFSDADYVLLTSDPGVDCIQGAMWPELWARMELVYSNGSFNLYRLAPEQETGDAEAIEEEKQP